MFIESNQDNIPEIVVTLRSKIRDVLKFSFFPCIFMNFPQTHVLL